MRNKRNYIFLIPLVTFLLVLQSAILLGEEEIRKNQNPLPGYNMLAITATTAQEKHDHRKHKKKEPVLSPGEKGKVSIGNRKGDPEKGEMLFKKYCIYCHGQKGLGDGPIVIGLETSPPKYTREEGILYMVDQVIFDIITYGRKTSYALDMPAWGPTLTVNDRLDVIAYIKSLAMKMYKEVEGKELPEESERALIKDDGGVKFHLHGGGDEMADMMRMKGVTPVSPLSIALIFIFTTIITPIFLYKKVTLQDKTSYPRFNLFRFKTIKRVFVARPFQFLLQLPLVLGFILVIVTGFLGDQNPGRNFATVATWTIWWAGIIFLILFLGASWCLICPWSALSDWIERVSFWKRKGGMSLKYKWPHMLKSRHTMTVFFVIVTWLELGVYITYSPRYTAFFAFLMFLLMLITAMIFRKKSFCRYVCFVGGIVGVYSNLAPLEVRSKNEAVCKECKTKDCVRGNHKGYPCPIYVYPGGMDKNTDCILCTECFKTCPSENMSLNLRPFFTDLTREYKGRFDEAILILTLLGLTIYHGFTMLPVWFSWAVDTMESNYFLYITVFSILLIAFVAVPIGLHYLISYLTRILSGNKEIPLRKVFVQYAYAFIPVAFFYHLSHNISHLNMEGLKIVTVLSDPFGWGWHEWRYDVHAGEHGNYQGCPVFFNTDRTHHKYFHLLQDIPTTFLEQEKGY